MSAAEPCAASRGSSHMPFSARSSRLPILVSLKVKELRKQGFDNAGEWLKVDGHVYIGRQQRVFVFTRQRVLHLTAGTKVVSDKKTSAKRIIHGRVAPAFARGFDSSEHRSAKQCEASTLLTFPKGSYVSDKLEVVKCLVIPESIWKNPFPSKQMGLAKCIGMYKDHLEHSAELQRRLPQLFGASQIGCWCHPQPCHGRVLIDALKTLVSDRMATTSRVSVPRPLRSPASHSHASAARKVRRKPIDDHKSERKASEETQEWKPKSKSVWGGIH